MRCRRRIRAIFGGEWSGLWIAGIRGGRLRAHFDVSPSFAVKLIGTYRKTGSNAAKPEGGWRYSKLDPHRDFLVHLVSARPDITMPELATEVAALTTLECTML